MGASGASVADLSARASLPKASAHRLLAALSGAGFAYQNVSTRRYCLGFTARQLALTAVEQHVGALAGGSLERLAALSGDTVFCSVSEGTTAVCIDRATGDFPIRTLTLDIGDRRPLGVGAGSLALLAAFADPVVEFICKRNESLLLDFHGFTPSTIRALVDRTRADGYALNEGGIVPLMSAVAVAVPGPDGFPAAAISIAAIKDRMTPSRLQELVALLDQEAALLEASFSYSLPVEDAAV